MILAIEAVALVLSAFPRVCGGDPVTDMITLLAEQLFPACAGVIPVLGDTHSLAEAFPRVCGGDPGAKLKFSTICGFSPRVRG